MSFNMAELDRFPGHRKEDRGARRRGGILKSTQRVVGEGLHQLKFALAGT